MANYDSLVNAVKAAVKTNGTGAITGATLQATLLGTIEELTVGFQFMGVATPSTSPDSNDKKEFYLGFAGTYANFGSSVTVPEGSVILFKKNEGAWSSQLVKIADPVSVSRNPGARYLNINIENSKTPVASIDNVQKAHRHGYDFMADVDNAISPSDTEYGYLNAEGSVISNSNWKTYTYDVSNIPFVFASGSQSSLTNVFCALYDSSDELIKIVDIESGHFINQYIDCVDAKYLRVNADASFITPMICLPKDDYPIINLFGIGTYWYDISTTDWKEGYMMYNVFTKTINTAGSVNNGGVELWYSMKTPKINCIYFCNGKIYIWNASDMICLSDLIDFSTDSINAITSKFVGDEITELSTETGALKLDGTVDSTLTSWRTKKYDVSAKDIVYASGRISSVTYLAATYDENDNLIQVFHTTSGSSANLFNIVIPVSTAKYIKVSGIAQSGISLPWCKDVASGQFADKVSKNELDEILPTFSIDKTIDIEQGSLNNSGKFDSLQRIRSVDFIASDGELVLNCNSGFGYRVYEYSSDSFSDFIRHDLYDNGGLNTFTPQTNTAYIRFVFLKTNGDNISVSEFGEIGFTINGVKQHSEDWDIASKQYVDSQFAEQMLLGKTVVFLGDSITAGGQGTGDEQVTAQKVYHKIFSNLTGCINVNLGVGGTCIANNTLNDAGSQRFVTRATEQNLSGADFIVVWGGTNDFSYDSKAIGDLFAEETITPDTYIGSKKRVAVTDTDSFAGALHDLITTIRSHNATAPILFMTPLNRARYTSGRPTSQETNQWGNWLDDFRDAIKKVCSYYSIPVFDIGRCSELDATNNAINTAYFVDGLHPNASGHKIIGTLLYHWFKANMMFE